MNSYILQNELQELSEVFDYPKEGLRDVCLIYMFKYRFS